MASYSYSAEPLLVNDGSIGKLSDGRWDIHVNPKYSEGDEGTVPERIIVDGVDVLHRDAVYTAYNDYGLNLQIRVTDWWDGWSCGYWYHSCTVYVYFGLTGSIRGDSVSGSSLSIYNDQTIDLYIHGRLIVQFKAGNLRANTTYSQEVTWYDNQTQQADIILSSANDDSPIRPNWTATIGGASRSPSNQWWNLGSEGGTKLITVNYSIGWTVVKSKSGTLSISNSVREY